MAARGGAVLDERLCEAEHSMDDLYTAVGGFRDDGDYQETTRYAPGSPIPRRSPMLRPKPRHGHVSAGWSPQPNIAADEEPRFGRRSPMVFEPLPTLGSADGESSQMLSMAGQITAQELRQRRGMMLTDVQACEAGMATNDPELMIRATVKVFVTQVTPSYTMPWSRGEETRSTGSGFVVTLPPLDAGLKLHPDALAAQPAGRIIVTNAHVVENHSLVQVRKAGYAEKYVARVVVIGHDVDLALLQVLDPSFWEGAPEVRLGTGIPKLASEVVAVGFPVGGDDVSATRGVVSRILVGGLTDNLCVQIDAAINPGNSGGPVFDGSGHLVGVAFSGLMNSNNIGYIIPLPVVQTFLLQFRTHGTYTGKCSDCFEIQSMENKALREKSMLSPKTSGVMLSRVPPESAMHGTLDVRDILMQVDGVAIANDGTIQLPDTQDLVRVTFSYLVYRAPRDHPLKLTILRKGEVLQLSVPAKPQPELLLACKQPLPKPTYLVVGGLVFVPLMSPYEALVPRRKMDAVLRKPAFEGQQVVVLLMVLRAEVNVGYEDLSGRLEELNGEKVQSLSQLKQQVERQTGGNFVFRLESGEMIVMSAEKVWRSEPEIFTTHCIPQRANID